MKTAILLLLFLVCSSIGRSQQNWIETSVSPGVSVSFPAKAAYQWSKREKLYTLVIEQVSLSVSVKVLPDHLKLTRYDQRGILEGAVHEFLKNDGITLLTSTDVTLGTTSAKEIYYRVKHPMLNSYTTGYARYFIVGRALYTMHCFFLEEETEQGKHLKEQFFNSINITS